ncbi:flagellar hook-length control protein FliK [Rubinisphaera sp.]|uniref:flagellar hook-length control protein FliK n=1 Tax=Rubinisphaera sp. TaxID=2024857 RepID=UPI000C102E40|nr:flagellar hook-length control protein FliK [Rubinisphaera sp.]MBV10414.1 hypothetical protein [Rubinisphaera sp.]HCS52896.1 hypothetical protein [Planctomycetaceae bacterium]|tara:strand:- start:1014 stop:2897 length:1884 start_codon:yes stop_codon:yes gene_type:complete
MLSRQDALSPITFIAERTLTNLAETQKSLTATQSLAKPSRPAFADRLKESHSKKPQTTQESTSNARPKSAPSKKLSGEFQVRDVSSKSSVEKKQKQTETRIDPEVKTEKSDEDLNLSIINVIPSQIVDDDEENLDLEVSKSEGIPQTPEIDHSVEATIPLSFLSATTRRQQIDTSDTEVLKDPEFSKSGAVSFAPLAFFNALDQNKNSTVSPLEGQPVLSAEELQAAVNVADSLTESSTEVDVISQSELQNQSSESDIIRVESPTISLETSEKSKNEAEIETQQVPVKNQNSENQSEFKQSAQPANAAQNAVATSGLNQVRSAEENSEAEKSQSDGDIQLTEVEDAVQEVDVEFKTEKQIEVHKKEKPAGVDSEDDVSNEESNSNAVSRYGHTSTPAIEHVNPQTRTSTKDVSGPTAPDPLTAIQATSLDTAVTKITSSQEQTSSTRLTETNTLAAENRTSASEVKAEVVRPVLDTSKSEVPQKLASFIQQAAEQGKALKIRLHPPELGTLQIEVNRLNGQVTAKIEVESAAARSVIFEQLGLLKESLTQQGIKVDQLQVEINEQLTNEAENSYSSESGSSDMTQDQQHQREHYSTTGVERDENIEAEEIQNASTSKIGVSEMDVQV